MDFFTPIWKGWITGILFTLTFGTVFFSLIQTSIKRGFKKALYLALGVIVSDAFFITLTILGTAIIASQLKNYDMQFRLIGASVLVFLGVRSMIKQETDHTNDAAPTEKNNLLYALKGIMLNSINPVLLFSWMGVTTYMQGASNFSLNELLLFFAMVLATMFSTMLLLSYYAGKLRHILSAQNLHRLNIFSGVVFLIFSGVIVWPVLLKLFNW